MLSLPLSPLLLSLSSLFTLLLLLLIFDVELDENTRINVDDGDCCFGRPIPYMLCDDDVIGRCGNNDTGFNDNRMIFLLSKNVNLFIDKHDDDDDDVLNDE